MVRETNGWDHALIQRNEACNLYNQMLHKTKNAYWKNWLENVKEQDIWRAGRFAKNPLSDGGCSQVPTLYIKSSDNNIITTYTTDKEKAGTFAMIFFPLRPPALPPMPNDVDPNPTPLPFNMLHLHQIM
jgi:hypothetical protein